MSDDKELLTVHIAVDIPTGALQGIVPNIKAVVGKNAKGHYQVNAADAVGNIIGKFLHEHDFVTYAADPAHNTRLM